MSENIKKKNIITKKEEYEVFTDPIYESIFVNHTLLKRLINTRPMQRLRKIKQLSLVNIVFHCAEHSRFNHSLGVYELARRFTEIKKNDLKKVKFRKREILLLLTSALLHDIGHGPFSHLFEKVLKTNHESLSAKIIEKNEEIQKILDDYQEDYQDKNFKKDLISIIKKKNNFPLIEKLLASQLDFDRLDYLKRDSFFAGISYGYIDANYLIRSMEICGNDIVFKKSAIPSIENYLINRYHMYCRVYYNEKVLGYSVILEKIFERIKELLDNKEYTFEFENNNLLYILKKIYYKQDDPNYTYYFLEMDDHYVNSLIMFLSKEKDTILVNLCNDFLNRNIWCHSDDEELVLINKMKEKFQYNEEEIKYYIYDYKNQIKPFDIYKENIEEIKNSQKKILIYDKSKKINHPLGEDNRTIIKNLGNSEIKQIKFKYFYRGKIGF
ncbi:MAG: HD domain-containing protein [Candidatus Phytoplasma stylosanthis]|uniref:HD domain-containing protein n=1 Tax=Candidatus Phytoplasma stylosanthis TaxID=2798314 RepID=UPI00293A5AD1|nr:HD domain-containing protein [Candidatus Phytoplasma stylosanthis]MDV3168003.1 HD domain-containing protein [Candidatus Phytoplasma stylosanthis]MDV3171073.1 HD domain-containing protein [Candidatus Phytoplasma stylosanthis]MDV3174265.1 HD domain-containing protein [Candidatus Phytoplasma stylosanthis]MDV3202621.1 HD domain-containing protein [Candidatus Phytoplasma stylosanthis]